MQPIDHDDRAVMRRRAQVRKGTAKWRAKQRASRPPGWKQSHPESQLVQPIGAGPGLNDETYPALADVISEWGDRTAQAYANGVSRKSAYTIMRCAAQSLPPHPTESAALAYIIALDAKGFAGLYVKKVRLVMSKLYDRARVSRNPFADLRLPKSISRPRKKARLAINDRNIKACWARVYDALEGSDPWAIRDRALLAVLRYTGVRMAEALALTLDQIDLGRGRITIEQQRDPSQARGPVVPYLKDDMQRRWQPMHPELVAELRRVLSLGPALVPESAELGARLVQSPLLFPHTTAQHERLHRKLCAILKDQGYGNTGCRWHSWRHAFALDAYMNTTNPPVKELEISKWLGHSSVAVTERYLRELRGYETPANQLASLWAAQARVPAPPAFTGTSREQTSGRRTDDLRVVAGRVESEGGHVDPRRNATHIKAAKPKK